MSETIEQGGFFELFLNGRDFDVDAFIQTTGLKPTNVWRRGQHPTHNCESVYETSGMKCRLGTGSFLSVEEQSVIALDFLRGAASQLRRLNDFGEVMVAAIRLHHCQTPGVAVEMVEVSHALVEAANSLDLQVAVFIEYND